jgi:hypothetical protein
VHAVRPTPGFALDIDTLDDLRVLARSRADRESARVATALLVAVDAPSATACAGGSRA